MNQSITNKIIFAAGFVKKEEILQQFRLQDFSRITDNKKFSKTVKPLLFNKGKNFERFTLIDKDDNQIHGNTQVAVNSLEIDESTW